VYIFQVDLAFSLATGMMIALGICMAILSSSIVGLAGILPPKYMSAFMLGLSLNALIPICLRVVTLASFGVLDSVKYFFGAMIFFGLNAAFLGVCAYGALVVIRQNVIIFNLAMVIEDKGNEKEQVMVDDLYYEDRNINKLMDANNTDSFNEAVIECVQAKN